MDGRSTSTQKNGGKGGTGSSSRSLEDIVLYRDGLMLVLNKPAGIAVHPGPGGGPNLEADFDTIRFGLPRPPSLAHRLDRDTSGCLVLGRHPKALRRLGKLFSEGRVEKTYWAVVVGMPSENQGTIDLPLIKRTRENGGWKMEVSRDEGQKSVTDFRLIAHEDGLSFVEFRPRTGRTHQIRVHAAAMGFPLLGDPFYGGASTQSDRFRLHLHARRIELPLYPKKPPVTVEAPLPPHMVETFAKYGFSEGQAG